MEKVKERYDECFICGHVDKEENFPEDKNGVEYCPICGSYDIDDALTSPYEDDDEDEEGFWGLLN